MATSLGLAVLLARTLFAVWAVGASWFLLMIIDDMSKPRLWGAGPQAVVGVVVCSLFVVCTWLPVFKWSLARVVLALPFVVLSVVPFTVVMFQPEPRGLITYIPIINLDVPRWSLGLLGWVAVVVTLLASIKGLRRDPATWSGATAEISSRTGPTPMEDLIESVAVDPSQAFVIEQALNASLLPAEREKAFAVIASEPELLARIEATANETREASRLARQLLSRVRI